MNRVRSRNQGYTIVETIIFLAVTGAVFTSTISIVSGQQARTEFTQAVRDVQTRIQDISNDISTGFYHNPGTLRCNANPGGPQILPGTNNQGTNEGCIFLGRAMQFAPTSGSGPEKINVYNVVGLRRVAGGTAEVQDFSQAKPTAMAPGDATNPGISDVAIDTITLESGMTVGYVRYWHNGAPTDISGFGYMSSLAQYSSLGIINSGSLSVDIIPIGTPTTPPAPGKTARRFVDDIFNFGTVAPLKNPNGGIKICMNSAGRNQHAIFTFGIDRKLTPLVTIDQGSC